MKPNHIQPAPAPEIQRGTRLYRFQLIGIPLLFVLPLMLGSLGVLGQTSVTRQAEAGRIRISVEYPDRFRFKQLNSVVINVTNDGTAVIDSLVVSLDSAYASRFSTVRAIPPFREPYTVVLKGIDARETRLAIIEIQAERYGVHEGHLRIVASDTVHIPLRTIVFP